MNKTTVTTIPATKKNGTLKPWLVDVSIEHLR
jgi:hypothetical protein